MKVKKFFEWAGSDPGEQEWFTEKYESVLADFEKSIASEIKFDPEKFWDELNSTNDMVEKFDKEISDLAAEKYEKLYVKGFDVKNDTEIGTPEYHRVVNAVKDKHKSEDEILRKKGEKLVYNFRRRRAEEDNALLENLLKVFHLHMLCL